ncbi:MAG: hypothetical protein PHP59_07950 [Methanofollis sp.]|uniref:hypothetical protein n=1 Tax=Methanofollis sp. TaxID=2052835 RepID=UPI00262809A9|nr:hypothetical protein [Methanofollis sp.]MDD4255292.1 hypothetical protein [Methanofollis sp.]
MTRARSFRSHAIRMPPHQARTASIARSLPVVRVKISDRVLSSISERQASHKEGSGYLSDRRGPPQCGQDAVSSNPSVILSLNDGTPDDSRTPPSYG